MLLLADGTTIDEKYKIVGTIGSGGFGSVYKAFQKQFDRYVALKVLNTNVLDESDGLLRFEREAKAMAGLQHKNIVAFYGYGVWQNAPYMVMELIEGASLQSRLHKFSRLDPLDAARILRQVCEGLSHAHANGVIHRDLKPSNIMLEPGADGRDIVKLIDFGLVKLMPGYGVPNQKLTEAGYAVGTCHYMSPEQCLGGSNIDHRADIYASASILYQVICGERPFDDEDVLKVMAAHINEAPKPLFKHAGSSALIDALQAIVNKGMAKDPEDRYQSSSEMAGDLGSVIRGESGKLAQQGRTSQRLVLPPTAIKQAQKKRLRWIAPAAAGLAAAAFFGYQFFNPPTVATTSDTTELSVFDEIDARDASPPVQPIPSDLKAELAYLDVYYRRNKLTDAGLACDRLLESAERERWAPFLQELLALKSARVYDAAGRSGIAQKTLNKALALEDMPDPVLRTDLQEALAQAAWLNHRFAMAHDVYDSLLVNGPSERRKRAVLGLLRLSLWDWDAKNAKPYMDEMQRMMTQEQRESLTWLLLRIAYAASAHDDNVTLALVNQLLSRQYVKPDDPYDKEIMNMDCELTEAALLKAGYVQLLSEVKDKTGVHIDNEELLNSKYHH